MESQSGICSRRSRNLSQSRLDSSTSFNNIIPRIWFTELCVLQVANCVDVVTNAPNHLENISTVSECVCMRVRLYEMPLEIYIISEEENLKKCAKIEDTQIAPQAQIYVRTQSPW